MKKNELALQHKIEALEAQVSHLRSDQKNLSSLLLQRTVGVCFMKFESAPLQWNDTLDKEAALDYTFTHLKISEVNQAMLDQYQLSRDAFIGLTPNDFFSLNIEAGRKIARGLFDSGTFTSKTQETKSDGTAMIVNANYICLYDENNAIEGLFCAQTEESDAQIFESTYEALYKNAPMAYQSLDEDGVIIRVNQKWCEETGYQEQEVVGQYFNRLLTPEHQEKQAQLFEQLKQEGHLSDIHLDIVTKSGAIINTLYEANVSKDIHSNFLFTNCVFKNLTVEQSAQLLVKKQKDNFSNLFNTIDSYLFILDFEGRIIDVNEAVIEKLGYTKSELIGQSVLMVHPEDRRDEAARVVQEMLEGKQAFCPVPLVCKNLRQVPVETHVVKGEWDGAPALFGISKDISQLRASEMKFSKAFELNPGISGFTDVETGKYVKVNSAFYETFRLREEEVIGKKAEDLIRMDEDFREKALEELRVNGRIRNQETVLESRNGIKINALMSADLLELDGRLYNYTTAVDISKIKDAEKALRAAKDQAEYREKEYRQLFENMTQGFALHKMIYNEHGQPIDYTFISVNEAFERQTGLSADMCVGKTVLDVLPNTEAYWIENYGRVASTGEALEFENYTQEIHKFFNVVAYCPQKDYFATIITDVTEKRKNEEALRLANHELKKAQEIAHTGTWYLDAKTKKVRWTEELYKTFGIDPQDTPPDFTQQSKIFTPESWDVLQVALNKTIETGIPYELELNTVKSDGTNGWLWLRGEQVKDDDGNVLGVWGASQDITKKKALEIELQQAKEKAEIASIYKNQFLANMSHEIRTPMNGVIGFASLLRNKELSSEKKDFYLDIIDSNSKQLLSLINDIIDVAKIEVGELKVKKEDCSIDDILKETEYTFGRIKEEKQKGQLKIKALYSSDNKGLWLKTDASRLKQVLFNLIGNAMKFTNEGGIDFGYEISNPQTVRFFVKDTGIGMPKDELVNIFERFRQIEQEEPAKYRGTGLGLAISRGIIHLLGGEIWVESELGKGSVFYFTLPLEGTYQAKQEIFDKSEETNGSIGKNKTVLIAEDEEMIRLYFEELFVDEEFDVLFAKDGKEAVELFQENPTIALVLMDIRMPIMSGEEASRIILERYPGTKIIAQTAFAMHGDKKSFLEQGFVDYISKPIDSICVKKMIKKYLDD